MPLGGGLYLETTNVILKADEALASGAAPVRYVMISVRDTGKGIEQRIQERIFEPFFTTEEIGKGVGLGPAAVHGIAQSHGGFVRTSSAKNRGTTFLVYLPAARGTPDGDQRRPV